MAELLHCLDAERRLRRFIPAASNKNQEGFGDRSFGLAVSRWAGLSVAFRGQAGGRFKPVALARTSREQTC